MTSIEILHAQLDAMRAELASIGLFRPGNLTPNPRKFGKPSSHCARPDGEKHIGWQLSRKVDGRSRNRGISPRHLEQTRIQLDNHDLFRQWVHRFVELNDQICDLQLKAARVKKNA